MLKEIIGKGSSIDEATQDAYRQLGISTLEDGMELEVLEAGKNKVLGLFGGKDAQVKITFKESVKEVSEQFLKDVIKNMGLTNITVEGKETEEGIEFDIEGEDVGFIIGRRGETLDALQYLTCLVANHIDNSFKRVTINTGDYREKREKTLESLGTKLALKCVKTGKRQVLEPMNAYERRIIHTAVQKVNGATSKSEGENINRHVVIYAESKYRNNRKGKNRKPYGKKPVQKNTVDPNRKPINEGEGLGLYGRID